METYTGSRGTGDEKRLEWSGRQITAFAQVIKQGYVALAVTAAEDCSVEAEAEAVATAEPPCPCPRPCPTAGCGLRLAYRPPSRPSGKSTSLGGNLSTCPSLNSSASSIPLYSATLSGIGGLPEP